MGVSSQGTGTRIPREGLRTPRWHRSPDRNKRAGDLSSFSKEEEKHARAIVQAGNRPLVVLDLDLPGSSPPRVARLGTSHHKNDVVNRSSFHDRSRHDDRLDKDAATPILLIGSSPRSRWPTAPRGAGGSRGVRKPQGENFLRRRCVEIGRYRRDQGERRYGSLEKFCRGEVLMRFVMRSDLQSCPDDTFGGGLPASSNQRRGRP